MHLGQVSNLPGIKIVQQHTLVGTHTHTVQSPLSFFDASVLSNVVKKKRTEERKSGWKGGKSQHLYKFVSQNFLGGSSWQFGPECVLDKGSGAWWEPYAGSPNQWTVKFNGEPPGWPWPYPGEVLCIMMYREGLRVCLLF